jgi:protein-tyrosine phosphatase
MWSYIVWAPFHLPTMLYTKFHTEHGKKHGIPVATEVLDGWWIGGRYGHELKKKWAGIVDLTVEFPELSIDATKEYMCVPIWDGTPPTPELIEKAAVFAAECSKSGDVMVHCAHGRGRSTCVMVACLVRAGKFHTWEEAFKHAKQYRPCIKLNAIMRSALTEWESTYSDKKQF